MATLVLSIAGGIVGGVVAGPGGAAAGAAIGTAVGGAAGSVIDQLVVYPLLFKPKGVEGPRLTDTQVQTATEGSPINFTLGTSRTAGTLIWSTDLIEDKHTKGGGFLGGPKQTTYTYSASFAVALGYGQRTIRRIWANGKIIYKKLLSGAEVFDVRYAGIELYSGSLDQMQSPTIVAAKTLAAIPGDGPELLPAFRGIAYVVFNNLQLADFGNAIPQINGRLDQDDDEGIDLDAAFQAILDFAGWDSQYYDLSGLPNERCRGMLITGATETAKMLEPLLINHQVYVRETAGKLSFVSKDLVDSVEVLEESMGVGDPAPSKAFNISDKPERDAPSEVQVRYIDHVNNFDQGQKSERLQRSRSNNTSTIDMPVNMSAKEARILAKRMLYSAYAQLQTFTTTFSPEMMTLQEGDKLVRTVAGRERIIRINDVTKGWNSSVEINGNFEQIQTQDASAPSYVPVVDPYEPIGPDNSYLVVLDIPPMADSQLNTPGVYLAVCKAPGAKAFAATTVYYNFDGTSDFSEDNTITLDSEATTGNTLNTLPPPPDYPDNPDPAFYTIRDDESYVDVLMDAGTLVSVTESQCRHGANWAMVGNEMIGFVTATLTAPNTYRLTQLYRGIRDTQHACETHNSDERFVLLDNSVQFLPLPIEQRNQNVTYCPVPLYGALADYPSYTYLWQAENVKCFRPYNISAVRNTDNSFTITWIRQSRNVHLLLNFAAGPLEEPTEEYELVIYNASNDQSVRVEPIMGTTTFLYTANMQIDDGRSVVGENINVRLRQKGSLVDYGRFITMSDIPGGDPYET